MARRRLLIFVKRELNRSVKRVIVTKKPKSSTLWPKEWSLEKVKRITQEASENVFENPYEGSKFRGISKDGYEVEFFSRTEGIIDNAYLYTKNLKH